jgi:GTP cyclohydrolase I
VEIVSSDAQVFRFTMRDELKNICRQLLIAIGEDPDRPGLQDTPRRFAKHWDEFINYDPGNHNTVFEPICTDQMVVVSGIKVWSLCEHHLLPFWCEISIGYIAEDKVLGLSKFAQIAHKYAHKLQVQERLVHQIADEISQMVDTPHVAVFGKGQHLCMVMRGIKTPGLMSTSVMRGRFLEKGPVRQEFFELIKFSNQSP